jgi:hypothetical protein
MSAQEETGNHVQPVEEVPVAEEPSVPEELAGMFGGKRGGNRNAGPDGMYHVKGKKYSELKGSRAKVWHGTAYETSGGLTKDQLFQDKNGNIKSRRAAKSAKKNKNLGDMLAKKGSKKFGPNKTRRSKSRRSKSRTRSRGRK